VNDARERLRQYLEQRREMGESEFVLDSLSVEDALKVLAFGAQPPQAPAPAARRPEGSSPSRPPADAPSAPPPDSAKRRAAAEATQDGDWRSALRAIDGVAPAEAPAASRASAPRPDAPEALPSATGAPPAAKPGKASKSETRVDGVALNVGSDAPPTTLSNLATLADVAEAISLCSGCALAATARNHVPGEGNPSARFVVVGEAPGATEDELGRPFVGKSGDLLTKILDAVKFKREDVFICNVLKHRPPGNRNPSASEIAACRPFLLRQLEILRPKVILALGTFAAKTLLETDSPIGKLRGIEHRYHGIPLVATYHPAALLRNPNWKRPAWEDVQLARRIFDRA
jgi:DNA polymerase